MKQMGTELRLQPRHRQHSALLGQPGVSWARQRPVAGVQCFAAFASALCIGTPVHAQGEVCYRFARGDLHGVNRAERGDGEPRTFLASLRPHPIVGHGAAPKMASPAVGGSRCATAACRAACQPCSVLQSCKELCSVLVSGAHGAACAHTASRRAAPALLRPPLPSVKRRQIASGT